MPKIEDLNRLFMDLEKSIAPYYKEIRVLQANLGIPFILNMYSTFIIYWQLVSMDSNQNRSYDVKDNTYFQTRNNVLQVDLYVKDILRFEIEENIFKNISQTKESAENLKILIDSFFRMSLNVYNLGFIRSVSSWTLIPTQFQDNRFIERWSTRFIINYVDSIEYQEAKAVIKEINIQEDVK